MIGARESKHFSTSEQEALNMIREKIINLTPHPVIYIESSGKKRTWDNPKSDIKLPRIAEVVVEECPIDGVRTYKKSFGGCDNLPDETDGVYYIVSAMIASALPRRNDLLVPNAIRDESGRIIGCDGFSKIRM